MNLFFDSELESFRQEIRSFLEKNLTDDVVRRSRVGMHPPDEDDRRWWNKVLHEKGWSAPAWPKEYGGPGWDVIQRHIFEMECKKAGAPELRWQGLRLIGPVLYTYGSDEQKARYLPKILSGEEQWAQGFSEPQAGSDLAALKTKAVLDGDEYVINGQKLWTTEAYYSEMGFFLCRTDPTVKKQAGISMLLVPMDAPGVTVRPITMINGDVSTAEVFLDNVRVPKSAMLGEPGSAWTQAKFLLGNERTSSAEIEKAYTDLVRIKRIARSEIKNGKPLIEDRIFLRELALLEMEVEALEWSVLRVLYDAPSNYNGAARASVLKVRGSALQQKLSELAFSALGQKALRLYTREQGFAANSHDPLWPDYVPGVTSDALYLRAFTIYGGAMEVQKNIIAKVAFEL
ncbi:MAG: acyl-CoA dehydrogenase family protein [Spongiibacteraceae bacterium]